MKIISLKEVDSTNSYVKRNFDTLEHLTIITANRQTAGYGRFKRNWVDLGQNNIFMSICLKNEKFLPVFSNLTQYASLCLAETFCEMKINPNIKWPNDILVDGKKIAGILAEAVFKNSDFRGVILGIGVNLNANVEDVSNIPEKKATALNLELNQIIDKELFNEIFLSKFFYDYEDFLINGFNFIKDKYIKFVDFFDKEITVSQPNSKIAGIAKSINDYGHLILEVNGENLEISTGDIN